MLSVAYLRPGDQRTRDVELSQQVTMLLAL